MHNPWMCVCQRPIYCKHKSSQEVLNQMELTCCRTACNPFTSYDIHKLWCIVTVLGIQEMHLSHCWMKQLHQLNQSLQTSPDLLQNITTMVINTYRMSTNWTHANYSQTATIIADIHHDLLTCYQMAIKILVMCSITSCCNTSNGTTPRQWICRTCHHFALAIKSADNQVKKTYRAARSWSRNWEVRYKGKCIGPASCNSQDNNMSLTPSIKLPTKLPQWSCLTCTNPQHLNLLLPE